MDVRPRERRGIDGAARADPPPAIGFTGVRRPAPTEPMERLSHAVLALSAAVPAAALPPLSTTVLQGPTMTAFTAAAPARFALSEHPVLYAEGTLGPVERDQAVGGSALGDGTPLTVDGRVFARGFGARATSAISVSLGGRAALFHAWVGIDDTADPNDRARFQVVADGTVLFDSGTRSGGQPALSTSVRDVRGVEELLLLALDDDDGFSSDFIDWCEPTVFAAGPPTGDDAGVRALRGRFGGSEPWPVEAIHAALVADPEFSAWLEKRTPAGRWGQVDELVGAAVFLSAPASSFVNGHTLYVDGGITASL